ncbi:hypothetical protein AWZ03_012494 [Drosophila navojoa]|uniref:Uncharacterized protein n=1 Tax=Drosophila navojoa TaxID=7232 RepID=A0A484AWQ8_DRONA|nr:hypothetical protein AWZ03_012494 [Drosophila navojoa]
MHVRRVLSSNNGQGNGNGNGNGDGTRRRGQCNQSARRDVNARSTKTNNNNSSSSNNNKNNSNKTRNQCCCSNGARRGGAGRCGALNDLLKRLSRTRDFVWAWPRLVGSPAEPPKHPDPTTRPRQTVDDVADACGRLGFFGSGLARLRLPLSLPRHWVTVLLLLVLLGPDLRLAVQPQPRPRCCL